MPSATPAASAISETREPKKPLAAKTSTAASMMRRRLSSRLSRRPVTPPRYVGGARATIRPLHETDARVPEEFTDLVLGCIQVKPEARIPGMDLVADRLDAIAERCERTGAGKALEGAAGMGTAPDRRLDSQSTKG